MSATGTLHYCNPADLLTDRNIREDLKLDRGFLASVREHGVLTPILATRTPDGIRVRAGHRRTAAALSAGLDTIPVLVIDADTDDDQAQRIIEQLTENHHRAALAAADTVAAVQQLALLGCSHANIARRTKITRTTVEAALAAADSDLSRKAAAELPALTIEHLGWLAEFEDDEHTTDVLLDVFTNRPDQARHAVERARQDRAEAAAAQAAHTLIAAAHPDTRPLPGEVYATPGAANLTRLADADGNPLTADDHSGCPGDAYVLHFDRYLTHDPESTNADQIHVDGHAFRIQWVCADWKANGHRDRWARSSDQPTDDGQDRAEQARQQRRRTLILNRAGDAAGTVRREWLAAFTTRKTAPKDAPGFLLTGLDRRHPAAGEDATFGTAKVAELLGVTSLTEWSTTQSQTRIAHIALCARLWAYEHRAHKTIWRDRGQLSDYLTALDNWGYELSEAERVATGELTEDQAVTHLTSD